MSSAHFDQAAATWDDKPQRVALMKSIGEAILRAAAPRADMDLLDYGCGTGLLGLYLRPWVRSVTGADNSTGMLNVLRRKIDEGAPSSMRAERLDLEHDPTPGERYAMIIAGMVLHHVADVPRVLAAFHEMLLPGGVLCLADLDTEPGTFHPAESSDHVHHHGFDRTALRRQLSDLGFVEIEDTTVATLRKETATGEEDFSVFLIVAKKALSP